MRVFSAIESMKAPCNQKKKRTRYKCQETRKKYATDKLKEVFWKNCETLKKPKIILLPKS